jgi:hypothetical protein
LIANAMIATVATNFVNFMFYPSGKVVNESFVTS